MKPKEFLNTVYLGDRACKTITIDGWQRRVLLQIDTISRIRSASGNWDYYTAEDITNGYIVFTNVDSIQFDPPGFIPNDYVEVVDVKPVSNELPTEDKSRRYLFQILAGAVDKQAVSHDVLVQIIAEGVHLKNPLYPGIEIME